MNPAKHEPPSIEMVSACLNAGGVILFPTDTVLGLAAAPQQVSAVEKLYRLKRRPPERRLPVMIASIDQLPMLGVDVTPAASRLLTSQYVPGPLTIALGFSDAKPAWLAERDEVAVRIPADPFVLDVLRACGPLFVTSANGHGLTPPRTSDEALEQLDGAPDLVVPGNANTSGPSTLVNCRLDPPVIERVGEIPAEVIERLVQ